MSKKVFVDANIILDIFDDGRKTHKSSLTMYAHMIERKFQLFTSCDIITTLYYIEAKRNKVGALHKIQKINQTLKVIEFSNSEVAQTCQLMIDDPSYTDLEDTIQYILAKKFDCDLIITNDKKFVSKDIDLLSSEVYCEKMNLDK